MVPKGRQRAWEALSVSVSQAEDVQPDGLGVSIR
jgi:hypothetical protein